MKDGILLGQSYYLRFDPKLQREARPYPPLGSLLAAAYLRERGYPVAVFDAMLAASTEEWDAALKSHRPRFAVLFEDNFNYLSKMCLGRMREAAFAMGRAAKASGATAIACGSDASDHARLYFQNGADFVVRGEGEETVSELIGALSGRAAPPLDRLAGLSLPDGSGGERRNSDRAPMSELDSLPFPAWDLVDLSRYRRIWRESHGAFSINMATTRGCPYRCNWCAKPIWGNRYHARSPANVARELRLLVDRHHAEHVWFADDILGLKPGWLEAYADSLEAEGLRVPFKCQMRADLITEGSAAALRRAGCENVWLGAESGSQKILDAMDKGTKVEDIARATGLLRRRGIRVGFFLQFGYPGETIEDVWKTVAMVRALEPDLIGTSVSYPLPGTPFYERVKAELGAKTQWDDSADLAMLYRGPRPTSFYRALHRWLNEDHTLRAAWRRTLRGSMKDGARVLRHGPAWAAARAALAWAP